MADEVNVNVNDPARYPAPDTVRYPAADTVRYAAPVGGRFGEIFSRVSWGAIWAGVMIALGLELLFTLFGFFIGFGMYNYQAPNPWGGIHAWTLVWYLVTAAISMFFGAWSAARLSGNPVREAGVLHGLATWGLATIATVLIVSFGTWTVMREGINMLSAAAITTQATAGTPNAPPPAVTNAERQANRAASALEANPGPAAQEAASNISSVSLLLWGGVLLGFITAILGGIAGRAPGVFVQGQPVIPAGPTRLAA
jgi:hypothetical protein